MKVPTDNTMHNCFSEWWHDNLTQLTLVSTDATTSEIAEVAFFKGAEMMLKKLAEYN